jgi:deglycase
MAEQLEVTSSLSLKTDLQNARATWVDREVVQDRGIVSSGRPSDIPAFTMTMIEEFTKGRHGSAGARQLTHTHA